jgi:hypothetical protein
MCAYSEALLIAEELEVLLVERRGQSVRGPHFRIIHRFNPANGAPCGPGEEVAAVYLVWRGREFQLRLSTVLRLLFDYLARHSRLFQSARQIECGMRESRFYARISDGSLWSTIPRAYVRVYIERVRAAIQQACEEAGLLLASDAVLVSEQTVMNEIGYRLNATVDWVHSAF